MSIHLLKCGFQVAPLCQEMYDKLFIVPVHCNYYNNYKCALVFLLRLVAAYEQHQKLAKEQESTKRKAENG